MKRDWQKEVKAILYAIGEFELLTCADGVTKATHSITHRKQRLVVEARYFKGKHRCAITVFAKGKFENIEYTEGKDVFWMGTPGTDASEWSRLYKKLERLVLRHYAEYQAEDILSRKLSAAQYGWL